MGKQIDLLDDKNIFKNENIQNDIIFDSSRRISNLKTYTEIIAEMEYKIQKGRDTYFNNQKKTRK